jgi:hypothetical protein
MSESPDSKKIEQILKRMTAEQFSAVCAELGVIESELGDEQNRQVFTLIDAQRGNLNRLVRAIKHVLPTVFDAPPARPKRQIKFSPGAILGQLLGLIGLAGVIAAAAYILINAINPPTAAIVDFRPTLAPVATQQLMLARTSTFTPTPTDTPTRTPTNTPDYDATLTATYAPTATRTRTPTKTPKPSSTGKAPTTTATSTPTAAPTLALIYGRVVLSKPPSNTVVEAGRPTPQLQWFIPNSPDLQSNERFRLRFWQDSRVALEVLTSNNWEDRGGAPNSQAGTYQWSVAVVKVDGGGSVIGVIGPESERRTITWK